MSNPVQKPKILSVDDNESNQYAIKKILERENYEVILAENGTVALERVAEFPDLIILDVNLPDISGFDVCKRIKSSAEFKQIPVLHVSASFIQSKDKVTGLESGADGYLAQPIDASVLLATVRSLLRIRKAEREKENLIQELKDERELREQFVSTLTHDLRNPLTAAKIGAQLLLRNKHLEDSVRIQVSKMIGNINRTDLMMQDLLDANLLRAGNRLPMKPSQTHLNALIQEVIEEFEYNKSAPFVVDAKEEIHGIWDSSFLKRAIENLISNALKYGEPKRTITICLYRQEDRSVKISVHNYGNPIPATEQGSLFDHFKRSQSAQNSEKKGWGLGLSLVRGVAEAHGGSVSVLSNADHGTTFSIVIPEFIPENKKAVTETL